MARYSILLLALFAGCIGDNDASKPTTEVVDNRSTRDDAVKQLVSQSRDWWEPIVTDDGHGNITMRFESEAASIEYDRQKALAEAAERASAPDDDVYVFDDTYHGTTYTIPRQDNGSKNKLGIESNINRLYPYLIPCFQQIAGDHAAREAVLTGKRLAAVQLCDPHFWNISIESVDLVPGGYSIEVSGSCGSRVEGALAYVSETWQFVDGQLNLITRKENIPNPPSSF